jgi:tetratricopeptide (TPR) repeat protein
MLDSRAMVSYRMGDYDAALKDLDSALELAPALSASLYLRGIVRLEQGDKDGRTDVERALRMAPELAERYAAHGVAPKK